jgi:hypothetical protein
MGGGIEEEEELATRDGVQMEWLLVGFAAVLGIRCESQCHALLHCHAHPRCVSACVSIRQHTSAYVSIRQHARCCTATRTRAVYLGVC